MKTRESGNRPEAPCANRATVLDALLEISVELCSCAPGHRSAHRDVELAEDGEWLGTGTRAGLREGDIRTGVRPGCLEEVPFEMGLEGRTAAAVDGSPHQSSSQSSLPCPCPAVSNEKHSFLVSLLLSISPPLEC